MSDYFGRSWEVVLGFASHTVRVIHRKLTELVVPKAPGADNIEGPVLSNDLVKLKVVFKKLKL